MTKSLKFYGAALAICASTARIVAERGTFAAAAEQANTTAANAEVTQEKQPQVEFGIYDRDPKHVWNRLHRALFVRASNDGREWGMDRVDPLLWPESTHLLEGNGYRSALSALDEFLAEARKTKIDDPLKRALFHSNLWAAFDWSATPRRDSQHRDARRALQIRLAKAMQQLALSAEEIQKLPDNYAAAVASNEFAREFDPKHPERPYLPPDLFDSDGPWVNLGAPSESIAPAHTEFISGRSTFLVFLRLPAGRQATLDYLEKLQTFPQPMVINPRYGMGPNTEPNPVKLNPELPQFPAGTQVALVRQMTTVDQTGELQPTRLTQMVQLRVYRSIGRPEQRSEESRKSQAFFEFGLSAEELFAGMAGGLRAVERDERDFIQFKSHAFDQLEDAQSLVIHRCADCHREPGIFSLNSYTRAFGPQTSRPVILGKSDADYQELLTRLFKQRQYDWGLLKGLRDRERP